MTINRSTAALCHVAILIGLLLHARQGLCADKRETSGEVNIDSHEATELALRAHAQAAAIDKLPRFYLRAQGSTGGDYVVKSGTDDPLENLIRALDPDVPDAEWYQYEQVFAWDEEHFVVGSPATASSAPDQPDSPVADGHPGFRFVNWGMRDLSGERGQGSEKPRHVLRANAAAMWKDIHLSDPNYLLATWHEFWWGDNNANHNQHFGGASVPPKVSTYHRLGDEEFDGETCEVVEARARFERLWISRKTGLIRGYVNIYTNGQDPGFHNSKAVQDIAGRSFATRREYADWYRTERELLPEQKQWALHIAWSDSVDWGNTRPGLIVRFRDFREIAPGVWWPLREDRAQGRVTDDGFDGMVSNFTVRTVLTDFDLSATIDAIRPKEGEHVQDQRYEVPVSYEYRSDRTEAEILGMVDDAYQERLKNEAILRRLKEPFEKMVSQPAPTLPEDGWIGGARPDLRGKPYLVHIWATWCAPCKNDLPMLKRLVDSGALVIGLHPAGTPADQMAEVIEEFELGHPTFVDADDDSPPGSRTIAGHPANMFPYYILVDAEGNVAAHGSLSEDNWRLLAMFRELREDAGSQGDR